MTAADRAELAFELADDAEALVQAAEDVLATADGPTAKDIAETRLRECLALQDEVAEAVAPAIERERRELVAKAQAAILAVADPCNPKSDWTLRHRKFHGPALKSVLIRACGGARAYARVFPW